MPARDREIPLIFNVISDLAPGNMCRAADEGGIFCRALVRHVRGHEASPNSPLRMHSAMSFDHFFFDAGIPQSEKAPHGSVVTT